VLKTQICVTRPQCVNVGSRPSGEVSITHQPIYVNEKITSVAAGNCNPTVQTATSHGTDKCRSLAVTTKTSMTQSLKSVQSLYQ